MTWRPALWLVAASVIVVDQVTKFWALQALEPYEKHEVLGSLLSWQLVFNSGAALSLGQGYTWVLTIVSAVVTVGIVVLARRARSRWAIAVVGIGLGGAIGNLIDRLFRDPGFGQGHVIDMINYGDLFVGNVADIAIVGAAIAVAVTAFTGRHLLEPVAPADDSETAAIVPESEPESHPDSSADDPLDSATDTTVDESRD